MEMAFCHSVMVTGVPAGRPMYHRMGIYNLLPFTHNAKPAYHATPDKVSLLQVFSPQRG